MIKSQDIQLADASLKNQFTSYFKSGDYTNAFNILANNPQLDSKKFVDVVLNEISTEILYLEQLYYTNVDNFLTAELTRLQTAIDDYKKIGTYSGSVQYKVNNFVSYNNLIYLCYLQPTIGTLPTNTTYWRLLGLKGEQGEASLDTTLKYEWNILTQYYAKDVVIYQDILYVAKQNNIGKIPPSNTTEWEVFLEVNKKYIHTEILSDLLNIDDIWYKALARSFDYLDTSAISWDTLDADNLIWNDFERGGYNG